MAFVIADRVKETSTTTGTGTLTLAGAVTGFQAFSAIGNANTTGYAIIAVDADGVPTGEWETGIGTYTSAGTTLSRGLIASSTGSAINFAAGTKHVICCDVANYMTPLVMATTANRAIQVANQTALSSTAGNARGSGAVDLQIHRNGASQVASGGHSFIGGGFYNTASGDGSGVPCGLSNTTSNNYDFVGGGANNTSSGGRAAILGGQWGLADKYGQQAHAAGRFGAAGDAQRSAFVLRKSTTDATPAELFLDGSASRLQLSNDTTWAFDGLLVARRTDADGTNSAWTVAGVIKRDTNAASTALVGTPTPVLIAQDAGAALTAAAIGVNTASGALTFTVTGEASKTYRWVLYLRTVEVTG